MDDRLLGRDVDAMRTKAGIEPCLRKDGVLEPAPKGRPPLRNSTEGENPHHEAIFRGALNSL